ncbi:hypothetical protein KRX52_04260 [Pseudomonas sp. MAP12]|uniref:Uncharacterized protein n=1 Tax=Geopseudomonas aromaticivorans TaxID=2849492 RepID=A0ABS6MUK1_9GAMM|nr:hypothetical protein [Pseudomonas aromaticivorans]MBV2132011.1 hypothetical protein [Pseudomonas aromaticivorans]
MKRKALIIGGGMLGIWLIAAIVLARTNCAWYGSQTERDTRYAAFVGCMVRVGNHWVPRAELRTEQ